MSKNTSDLIFDMIIEFNDNVKQYKNSVKQNLDELGLFKDKIRLKIENINNIISNLQEIEGSFVSFNEKFNISTLVIENFESFFY